MSRLRVAQALTAATFLFATFALYGHQSAGITALVLMLAAVWVGRHHLGAWVDNKPAPPRRSRMSLRTYETADLSQLDVWDGLGGAKYAAPNKTP